jgi:formylglycine-generating enzyme required for sulfatase activity
LHELTVLSDSDDGHIVAAPVGSYRPNPYGLYDMLGNVAEWCSDWYAPYPASEVIDPSGPEGPSQRSEFFSLLGSKRVPATHALRGGSWAMHAPWIRVAFRAVVDPDGLDNTVGFRLVVDLPRH